MAAFWIKVCGGMIPPHTTYFVEKSKDTKSVPVVNYSPQQHVQSVATKETTDAQGGMSEMKNIDRGIRRGLSKSTKHESKPSGHSYLGHCELIDCWNFGVNCKDELYICSSSLFPKMHDVYGPRWRIFIALTVLATFVATFLTIKLSKLCTSHRGTCAKTGHKLSETKKINVKDIHHESNQKVNQSPTKKNVVKETSNEENDDHSSKIENTRLATEYVDRAFTTKKERRRSSLVTGPIQIEKRVRLVW